MVQEHKVELVREVSDRLKGARVVGIADAGRLPSRQMQVIRRAVGGAELRFMKRSLLRRALEEAGLGELAEHIPDKPVLIISEQDAFSLFREINSQKAAAPAKAGMVAEKDIVVPKGGTGLPPGQAIGDLQTAGIPAKIEKGQIVVTEDKVVAKAGEVITPQVANALAKLELKPFEHLLRVVAIKERNLIFTRDVLDVDIERLRGDIAAAGSAAFALAYSTGYPVKEVVELKLQEAARHGKSLALNIEWLTEETLPELLSKANAQAVSLNQKVGGG